MNYQDETPIVTAAGIAMPQTSWALIEDGRVAAVVSTNNHEIHPFGADVLRAVPGSVPLTGRCGLRVTGTIAHTGFLVDRMGNVTPCEGRKAPLRAGESAMRSGPGAAVHHIVASQQPQTVEHESVGESENQEPHHGEADDGEPE
ncbi:hypothetical protein [Acetobacter aceti]|uniref:Uncharacterized protein n=1 Tax=Acetobacter aceti TaxID=435 RepID=A0A6S6PN52_ACEAC|nr:hypothetical protein [Acetobacter aceti]BCI68095.1 hypothetical protein AAJCM20276_27190 [Acetobacter aceti]